MNALIPQDKPALSAHELYRFLSTAADPAMVWPRFAHWLLVDPADGVLRFVTAASPQMAIWAVADLYSRWIAGQKPKRKEWVAVTVIVASFGTDLAPVGNLTYVALAAAAAASDAEADPSGNGRAMAAYYAARAPIHAARAARANDVAAEAAARKRQAEKLWELTETEAAA